MIEAKVVFDGDYINIGDYTLFVSCKNGIWYVEINGVFHEKTLEQAIAYCLEN